MTARRQQALFAAEDWKIAYQAFTEIDFQAYDFDSIRVALVEYVRTNFPENFNDYVESSEFIAIIEMLAYLAQSLSFRVDVNTRENFLETAERRDSVFKLAQMLGYNPKRNIAASGLMKITAVKTTEQLTDSLGTNLNNRTVFWNDVNNAQSYEQFITIMNAAMSRTNRFTTPVKEGRVADISTELYQLNTPLGSPITYNVNIRVDGSSKQFNVVNPDFVDGGSFRERHPDPANLFHMIYRNDGKGLESADTGFFLFLKQGTLDFEDYNYTTPVENRQQDILVPNINEADVYLQEITENGLVLNKWEKIPNTVGQTLNFNSRSLNTRNLYAVETLGTAGVRLRFTDGNFGRAPVGVYRFWHRVSEPRRFTVPPEAARNLNVSIPYQDSNGQSQQLTITFALQRAISNSLPPESLAAIKQRAPQVYYTQNRMVSAQDYNVFPESQSQNITKIKAINRTHAGHSRYIELNDPTGTFYNVDTFADDAYLYREVANQTQNIIIDNNTTALDVVTSTLPNKLKELSINNFVYQTMRDAWQQANPGVFRFEPDDNVIWNPQPIRSTGREGFLTETFSTSGDVVSVLTNQLPSTRKLQENTFLKFVDPDNTRDYVWVRVVAVRNNGRLTAGVVTAQGPWTLSADVPAGWRLEDTIVTLRRQFTNTEREAIEQKIKDRTPLFGIGYNLDTDLWYVIEQPLITEQVRTGSFAVGGGDGAGATNQGGSTWLFLMQYQTIDQNSYRYTLTSRGEDFVVQSRNKLKFYNVKNIKVLDATRQSSQDLITITTTNTKPGGTDQFEWIGDSWRNVELGTVHRPRATRVDLPLKTRDVTFRDISANWISNFGIFKLTDDFAGTLVRNEYVPPATLNINVFHPVGAFSSEANLVIANNTGRIETLPSSIQVEFSTSTFGNTSIVNNYGGVRGILYRQQTVNGEEVFFAPPGDEPVSLGANPDGSENLINISADINNPGSILLISEDGFGSGVLQYRNIGDRRLLNSEDRNGRSRDLLQINYEKNQEQLEDPIQWTISDVYREADGFVDPRRVKVAPLDSDGDLVPDRPRQFTEFVDADDIVLFENYQDFDGYVYARPFLGQVLDLRDQEDITVLPNQIGPAAYNDFQELSAQDWILLKTLSSAQKLENNFNARGIVVYVQENNTVFEVTPSSTQPTTDLKLEPTTDWFVRPGRGATQNTTDTDPQPGIIRWQHVAPNDVRVDPSISNIVEMVVLTTSYNDQVRRWQARPVGEFPLEPTSDQLSLEFEALNEFKSASDVLAFRSAKFRLLFGDQADDKYKARFRVVKLSDQISDNELKTRIISTINDYFDVDNWDFGEAFYFTELSTFIHQRLGSNIGSIVILPKSRTGRLGELFQVQSEPNELFLSTATVNDIEIVSRLDNQTLRIDR